MKVSSPRVAKKVGRWVTNTKTSLPNLFREIVRSCVNKVRLRLPSNLTFKFEIVSNYSFEIGITITLEQFHQAKS